MTLWSHLLTVRLLLPPIPATFPTFPQIEKPQKLKKVKPEVEEILKRLKKFCVVGFVGGSDLSKQKEQLGEECTQFFDYSFAENGLTAYRRGEHMASKV